MRSAVGYPNYTASRFFPEIWTSKIILKIHDKIQRPNLETCYEGEIKKLGDRITFKRPGKIKFEYVTIDQTARAYLNIGDEEDLMRYQSDFVLMDSVCDHFRDMLLSSIWIPQTEAFFACGLEMEGIQLRDRFKHVGLRADLFYVVKSLDPFRQAAEIAIEGRKAGLTDDEILSQLKRGIT